jgi:hypothetical protein
MRSIPRFFACAALATVLLAAVPAASAARQDFFDRRRDSLPDRILKRWVGAKVNGLPLWLDFFADSMLVVSDNQYDYPVNFARTPRTLIIYADTSLSHMLYHAFHRVHEDDEFFVPGYQFVLQYRFSLEKLLVEVDDVTITMTEQNPLARPMETRRPPGFSASGWIADLSDSTRMLIEFYRGDRVRHRITPGGSWTWGEWHRTFRDISFDWTPDSLEVPDSTLVWSGSFDAPGQQILLESIGPGTSVTIFRRIIRR